MDYSATIQTKTPPDMAARKIVDDLEHWWSTRIDRRDTGFTIHFNASHVDFAFDPGATDGRFSWTCTAANMIIADVPDSDEWTGTRLIWEIRPSGTGSAITLTHKGLTPQIACFDVCRRGWEHFFESSLRNHLNGDAAQPETSGAAA
ncbi:hypothetical protein [uncultured Tateyamaria sp.]|uniref:hypothetical protein n=1 Tax=Tateyamaria sp. 1078 TaxID=3417464 RepID=UPI002633FD62|nr:hypothetical protein [uncultured Tateyamaria sp.]